MSVTKPIKTSEKAFKILLVDDTAILRITCESCLKDIGYQVLSVESGEDCLTNISGFQPDLLISDIMLPGIDGVELVRRIRATPEGKDLPIILTSSKSRRTDIMEGIRCGANHYFVKPYDFSLLEEKIKKLLG